ncbi:hypothetical protein [Novosphingobium sp. AP12]|uniref:hypothetical protein n=1 Tax=Novosphingobium sp. AP12 TaxID=1144305 RepID=UPI000272007E|nr:hypothetical protein [Novosphingobium sp. AP12]EJL24122.1 hypothetical protein PMI02_03829 [Novosphingobium sp. AP12]
MTRAKARFLALLLPFGMAACSTSGSYPSLAVRDVERVGGSGTPAADEAPAVPALPPASADLVTKLKGLVNVAEAADRQFQTNRTAAQRAVAAAGSEGSDSWSAASVALAKLESSRSSGMGALAELDLLYAEARSTAPLDESPSATAIGGARSQVAALLDAQDKVIAELSTRLKA